MTNGSTTNPDAASVAVVGGGPVGLATAIALGRSGAQITLIARKVAYSDNRTTALLGASIDFLDLLEVWETCAGDAAPLQTMRLVDDTGRLIRAPEVRFDCSEIGRDAFGYNIPNRALVAALEVKVAAYANVIRIDDDAANIVVGDDAVTITTAGGQQISVALAIGADGRHSLCREAAGITVKRRDLNQTAITFNISHARPHKNVSTEFHTPHGPCVFVPLPGNHSSVVWVTRPDQAARLRALDDEALSHAAEKQSHSILGAMTVDGPRFTFPLSIETPAQLAAGRVILAGEAAHVLPPIGAQGLNMGLRDAADIATIVSEEIAVGGDPGSERVMSAYRRKRQADIVTRTFAIDLANRSLLTDFALAQPARALGLHLMGSIGPLRRLAMREGLSPSWR